MLHSVGLNGSLNQQTPNAKTAHTYLRFANENLFTALRLGDFF